MVIMFVNDAKEETWQSHEAMQVNLPPQHLMSEQ